MSSAVPAGRPRLTVAMLVNDDPEHLPTALASIREIADEILVVDPVVRESTVRSAQLAGGRVLAFSWDDDFSAARNRALEEATGDWILCLDAGEKFSSRCAAQLRSFIDSGPATDCAWLCMIEIPPERTSSLAERIGQIRLVPRRTDLRFSGRVQETLRPAISRAGMKVAIGPWQIAKSSREHEPEFKRVRALRDLRLIEREIREQGTSPRLLLALGECCTAIGNLSKAANFFRQAVKDSAPGSTEMLSGYYGLLSNSAPQSTVDTAQLEVCIKALEVFPYDAQLLCAMGGYLQAQGQPTLAQRSYRAANQFGQVDPETWHVGSIGEIAVICLSLNLQLASDDSAALAVLEEAQTRFPKSTSIVRRRLEIDIKHGRTSRALELVEHLVQDQSEQEVMRRAVRGACAASQQNWIPALADLKAAFDFGCRDAICLRWYTFALFNMGNRDAAAIAVDAWAEVEPACAEMQQIRAALDQPQEGEFRGVPLLDLSSTFESTPIPAPHMHRVHWASSHRANTG